ncbi:MAG: phytoene desaturase family protein [Patescibacteria group bacterium]
MSKVTIVGAGLTGICLSILLTKRGYDVTVVEKNTWPGGIFASKNEKKYIFNSGLEFYFPHSWLLNFFSEIGEDINQHLKFTPVKNKFKVFFDTNPSLEPYNIITMGDDLDNFSKIIKHLEGDTKGLNNFFKTLSPLHEPFTSEFLKVHDVVQMEKFLLKNGITGSLDSYIRKYFTNPNTIAFFDSFSYFFGDEATKVPAYYVFLLIDIIQKPLYQPDGGFTEIAEKLYFISSKLGTKFWFGQEIESVAILNNRLVSCQIKDSGNLLNQLQLNKENKFEIPFQQNTLSCDSMIYTGDYEFFEQQILKDPTIQNYDSKFWSKQEFTPSYSTFFLGLNDNLSNLESHCFIPGKPLAKNTGASFESTIYFNSTPGDEYNLPTMKILSFQDPNSSITGEDNDKLLLDCIRRISQATKLNLGDYIAKYIKFEPEDLREQFNYVKKSPYGIRHNLSDPATLLSTNNKKITNLFYGTNSNYPGGNGLLSIVRAKSLATWLIDESQK